MQYCVHRIDLKSYLNVSLYLLYLMGMYFSRTQYKNSMQKFTSSLFDFLLICLDFQGVLHNEHTCVHLNHLVNFVACNGR